MGLAEVHQTLVRNELRERVVVRVDGGVRRWVEMQYVMI